MIDKLRFRAHQVPSGLSGTLMLEAQEAVDELAAFLREQHRFAKQKQLREPEYVLEFDVEIQRWYKRRSLNANNLAWELATRLGQADAVSKEVVYYSIKELVDLPRDEYKGVFVSRPSGELNTVEFARFIQQLVIECQTHVPAVEIKDIWILFTEWRFKQETDPLEGTYYGPDDYREKHLCCEACGRYLITTDKEGADQHAGELAHIVSTGASGGGGARDDWLWLMLCSKCHLCIQHAAGWEDLLTLYPHLRPKVDRARERAGKKPLATIDGGQIPAAAVTQSVELVTQVFGGEIVATAPEAPDQPPPDEKKEKMLACLQGLQKKVEKEQPSAQAAEPTQPGLFDEAQEAKEPVGTPTLPVEVDSTVEAPAPSYSEDGSFNLPPDF